MTPSDFHRTNINLNTTDVAWLRDEFGEGWTAHVRDIIHDYILQQRRRGDWPSYGGPVRSPSEIAKLKGPR